MKIYNTLTKKKEEFTELNKGRVLMYVCGPTVYNYIHIGNARPFIVFDAFRNFLKYMGYNVTYVQNFTDVDDKIINRAIEEKKSPREVADFYIDEYFKDVHALGIKDADVHPRVTGVMDDIISFIKDLIEKGYAYELDGDVYFDTAKDKDYGKLSGKDISELIAGARIEINDKKKNPTDFALWKKRKIPEEIAWESPWGMGRPGWHIECSVMSQKYLDTTIDIHAGGQDLIFPHHENEIAQSECRSGKPFARYWMHNGYINVDNIKMSKSLGNFFTVRDVLGKHPGEVIRFFMLTTHYRGPINYSKELLDSAKVSLKRITTCKENLKFYDKNPEKPLNAAEGSAINELSSKKQDFIDALSDDFNTADAISVIFETVRIINSALNETSSKEFVQKSSSLLDEMTGVLNIANLSENKAGAADEALIEELIAKRSAAKKAKDFKTADEIRDKLTGMGVAIEDTRTGVKWSLI